MQKWSLYEAKNKLSNIVETAQYGEPQCITKHGTPAVIVIAIEEYRKLRDTKGTLKNLLLGGPKFDDLEIVRSGSIQREVDL